MIERASAATPHGFSALIDAATAIQHGDSAGLGAAFEAVSETAMLRIAARHRCLGHLRRGITRLKVKSQSPRSRAFLDATRAYAAKAAVRSLTVRNQLDRTVRLLSHGEVPFVLLKGSARLFCGDDEAELDTMYDLDILVPRAMARDATAFLERHGYHGDASAARRLHYWEHHHHLAPLQPDAIGLPLELHVELAQPGVLSIPTDWGACARFHHRVARDDIEATCFDDVGTALHLTVHALGLRRLHDVVMLARILGKDSSIYDKMCQIVAGEQRQRVALHAALTLAGSIAGLDVSAGSAVERYVAWVARRESLAPSVRDRTQFTDAWYGNGGALWGPATHQALPERSGDQSAAVFAAFFAYQLVGRLATSAYVALPGAKRVFGRR